MRLIVLALGLLALSAPAAMAEEPIKWVVSDTGGSRIEVPSFFVEGKVDPSFLEGKSFKPKNYPGAEFRQYDGSGEITPFEYIRRIIVGDEDDDYKPEYLIKHPPDKITYTSDKSDIGVISGTHEYGKLIYFGMCRKHEPDIHITCFDMTWSKKDKAIFEPIAKRIAQSFRKNK